MIYLFRLAYRNVLRHFRQSTAALLSVSATLFCVMMFEGYVQNVKSLYWTSHRHRSMLGDFLIEDERTHQAVGRKEPWLYWMDEAAQAKMNDFLQTHHQDIDVVLRNLSFQGMISNGRVSAVTFVRAFDLKAGDQMRGPLWHWNAFYGKPLLEDSQEQSLLIGKGLGRNMDCLPTGPKFRVRADGTYPPDERAFQCYRDDLQMSAFTESAQLNALSLKVDGLVDGGYQDLDNRYVQMSFRQAQVLLNTKKVGFYTIMLKDPNHAEKLISDFETKFGADYPHLKATRWQKHALGELYRNIMELLSIFRNFVVIVILVITVLSVLNTFIKLVRERTREIGLLQSLGFTSAWIQKLFFAEALILSSFGIVAGGALALVVGLLVNTFPIYYRAGLLSEPVPLHIGYSGMALLWTSLGLLILAGVTAWISSKRTTEKNAIENLIFS